MFAREPWFVMPVMSLARTILQWAWPLRPVTPPAALPGSSVALQLADLSVVLAPPPSGALAWSSVFDRESRFLLPFEGLPCGASACHYGGGSAWPNRRAVAGVGFVAFCLVMAPS